MSELIFRRATDFDMYEVMRLRNAGRQYMTHDTHYITPEEQYDWWTTRDNNAYQVWIVTTPEIDTIFDPILDQITLIRTGHEIIVGFCMLRYLPDGKVWGTLAVDPDWQGVGYGTAIYRFMIDQADQVWIEIRNDNIASLRAAHKAGFVIDYVGGSVTTLVGKK